MLLSANPIAFCDGFRYNVVDILTGGFNRGR